MAHALYMVMTPYSLTVNTNDLSGGRAATAVVESKHVFVGESVDPLTVSLLASGAIKLMSADVTKVVPTFDLPSGSDLSTMIVEGRTSVDYPKTSVGAPLTLLDGTGAPARVALVMAIVTEAFVDGTGTQPTFAINKTGTANYFAASSIFTNAPLGKNFIFGGFLAAGGSITVTAVAATGVGTGALNVTAIILPASYQPNV